MGAVRAEPILVPQPRPGRGFFMRPPTKLWEISQQWVDIATGDD